MWLIQSFLLREGEGEGEGEGGCLYIIRLNSCKIFFFYFLSVLLCELCSSLDFKVHILLTKPFNKPLPPGKPPDGRPVR